MKKKLNTQDENILSTNPDLQSWIDQETDDKKSKIKETLEDENISDSVDFVLWEYPKDEEDLLKEVKRILCIAINKSKNPALSWTTIIQVDYKDNNNRRSDYAGIKKAFDTLLTNPDKKVILFDTIVNKISDYKKYKELASVFERNKDLFALMNQNKNFRFFWLGSCDFLNAIRMNDLFQEEKEETKKIKKEMREKLDQKVDGRMDNMKAMIIDRGFDVDKTVSQMSFNQKRWELGKALLKYDENLSTDEEDITEKNTELAFQKIIESEIGRFLHNRSNWADPNVTEYKEQLKCIFFDYKWDKPSNLVSFENHLINLLELQHPSFKNSKYTREHKLQWIIDIFGYISAKTLPEWTRFEWVFVDRDWTLYDNKAQKFNQNIIDMIKKYEQEWKKIIIRTWWNIEMKQKLLEEVWLDYKVESKTDYKWATVEIAIDNDNPEFMLQNAKIKAEKYIKV